MCEVSVKMKTKYITRNEDHLIAEVDKGIKNPWKWEWLEELIEYEVS